MNVPLHPKNEADEAAIMKTEEYKLDSYFLGANSRGWMSGDLAALEEELVEVVNNVPDYYPVIFELCNIYRERGDGDNYRQMLEYALKKHPGDDMILMMRAAELFSRNEVQQARAILEKLATAGVEAPLVMRGLGDIYLALRMPGEAIRAYTKSYAKYDAWPEVHVTLVRLYYESADFVNALLELKYVSAGERTLELQKIEGVCNYYRGDHKAALAIFSDIAARHPGDIMSLMFAGDICLRFEKNYKAEFYWDAALRADPATPEDRAYIARIRLFICEYDEAARLCEYNLRQTPDHWLSLFTLGLVELCEDKFHNAAASWSRVLAGSREIFEFEFAVIRVSLNPNRLREFVFKVAAPEYSALCDFIRERCEIAQ